MTLAQQAQFWVSGYRPGDPCDEAHLVRRISAVATCPDGTEHRAWIDRCLRPRCEYVRVSSDDVATP